MGWRYLLWKVSELGDLKGFDLRASFLCSSRWKTPPWFSSVELERLWGQRTGWFSESHWCKQNVSPWIPDGKAGGGGV